MIDQLARYKGVHSGLPKQEFVELLCSYSTDSLNALRAALFSEVCALSLVPDGLRGLPLVDSALRPISRILGEDIWVIVQCITNKDMIPRTILKNGKRSMDFLAVAPRPPVVLSNSQPTSSSATFAPTLRPSLPTQYVLCPHPASYSQSQHATCYYTTLTTWYI